MPTTSPKAALLALAAAALLAPGSAVSGREVQQGSPKFDNLVKCRKIAEPVERLACYDANVAPLEAAIASKDILIVDRSKAEEANRSLFGYGASGVGQFLGLGNLDQIDSTVASSGFNGDGGVIVTLADGSRWSQQDDKPMYGSIAKGAAVKVVRGTLGSYIVRIKGQIGFKAIRIG
ncbi:MAG: hypothetical protein ABIO29_08775 [Sphingomicrobium sp.]